MKNQFPDKVRSLIMVDPQYFDIEYAINPFMCDTRGQLHRIDKIEARKQWESLQKTFENIGLTVHVVHGAEGFPDMVFCANQSFPFIHPRSGDASVIMSRMRASQRAGEVSFFEKWYQEHNYKIYHLEGSGAFEANGDLIPVPGGAELWGGFGPRTDKKVYEEIGQRFGLKIYTLELIHPQFYHLDTCFFVINKNLCAYVQEAFSPESLAIIESQFAQVVQIPLGEGVNFFAGNAFCPDGKNVVMQKGATQTKKIIESHGLHVIEVETSEYMKSGGSVFCMKMALPI